MTEFQKKAAEEIKNAGNTSPETIKALEELGNQQSEIAQRLLEIEQSGGGTGGGSQIISMGKQFTDSEAYQAFTAGQTQKARFEVQNNTLVGSDTNVAPDRKAAIVPGDTHFLTLENLFPSIPTS
ncbi:MAG: hypothetical protein GY938_13655, partial [Ketobacter sp.]|nr:hypothetical protein [Ketobacter sp.]